MVVYGLTFSAAVFLSVMAESSWRRRGDSTLPRGVTLGSVTVTFLLITVSALRWQVGTDYRTYHSNFPRYVAEVPGDLRLLGEPGIRIIAWFSSAVNGGSATMFAIAALITIGLMMRTLWRWSPHFTFAVAVYILSGGWHVSFNVVRQFLACAILFAGHRFIVDRRLLRWIGTVLVASLFHVTALIGILIVLVPTKRVSAKIHLVIFLLAIVFSFGTGSIFELARIITDDPEAFRGAVATNAVHPLRIGMALVPLLLYWIFRPNGFVQRYNGWFYINMLAVYAALSVATMSSALVARFNLYTLPFLAIGIMFGTGVRDPRLRTLVRGFTLVLYAIYMYTQLKANPDLSEFHWLFERP